MQRIVKHLNPNRKGKAPVSLLVLGGLEILSTLWHLEKSKAPSCSNQTKLQLRKTIPVNDKSVVVEKQSSWFYIYWNKRQCFHHLLRNTANLSQTKKMFLALVCAFLLCQRTSPSEEHLCNDIKKEKINK